MIWLILVVVIVAISMKAARSDKDEVSVPLGSLAVALSIGTLVGAICSSVAIIDRVIEAKVPDPHWARYRPVFDVTAVPEYGYDYLCELSYRVSISAGDLVFYALCIGIGVAIGRSLLATNKPNGPQ